MFLIQLDHNQIYVCLIQITATNFSETHFIIIFHSVIHPMLRSCVFWDVMLVGWGFTLFQRNVAPSSSSVECHKAPWQLRTCEMLWTTHCPTKQCKIPEDSNPQQHCCDNLKSWIIWCSLKKKKKTLYSMNPTHL